MATTAANGLPTPPQTEKAASSIASPPRVILSGKTGRILCVADIRGDYHELNRLIREHEATAVIHTGDFGFINAESLERMGDKILRHLLQYSPLIPPATRSQLLSIPPNAPRETLITALNNAFIHFPLSQFPHLLTGAITFPVPVFTVWGLIEDVHILEKFRTGEYEVQNLTVIDEACSRVIETGGVKLRLFGLGGAVALHKMWEGQANIAGQNGTMWATALQLGELVDTAQRTFDPTETRLFVSSAPIGRNGILSLLAKTLQADLTISGGLHFRYPSSYNHFAVHNDFEGYKNKLLQAQKNFMEVYNSVKERVDASMSQDQRELLKKALTVVDNTPTDDDGSWLNTWNWTLSDASCGHLLFSVSEGRVNAETKSLGLSFAHRAAQVPPPPTGLPMNNSSLTNKLLSGARPGQNALLSKPAAQQPAASNNVKSIVQRPTPVAAAKPSPAGPSVANVPSTSAISNVQSSIPSKPPMQPRQPRGPPVAPAASRDNKLDVKPEAVTSKSPAPVGAKTPTPAPQANGKPTPTAPASKDKPKPAPTASSVSGKKDAPMSNVANGVKEDEKKDAKTDKEDEKKAEGDKDKPVTDSKDKEGKDERPAPPKRHSLYIKGIPVPTSEDELKALFPDTAKVTLIKIIHDHLTKKQKDFAYVDFETEEHMQEALKAHTKTIRDTEVSVVISNPPARFSTFGGGMRGRGSFRGGRGGRGGFGRKED